MKTALLLSGGIDSLCLAWWKRPEVAFTFDYGQLAASGEIDAAGAICRRLGIPHHILRADCSELGSGDLAGKCPATLAPETDWWPFRNQLIVTLAGMRAIPLSVTRLLLGIVKSDGYHRDSTVEFVNRLNSLVSMQEGALVIEAPAITYTTAELIQASGIPPSQLAWAHSCHKSDVACGNCRGCNKYLQIMDKFLNLELCRNEVD